MLLATHQKNWGSFFAMRFCPIAGCEVPGMMLLSSYSIWWIFLRWSCRSGFIDHSKLFLYLQLLMDVRKERRKENTREVLYAVALQRWLLLLPINHIKKILLVHLIILFSFEERRQAWFQASPRINSPITIFFPQKHKSAFSMPKW